MRTYSERNISVRPDFDKRPIAILLAALLLLGPLALAGCAPSYPLVAEVRGDAAFKARIADTYPPGSPAARLREMLAAQNFRLIEDPLARRYSAIEAPPNLPCFSTTRIDWTEDARGRIARIQAARHACS